MLNRCENLSKLELYTFVARVGISSILIFGPHKTIAEHSYVQLCPGICTVTQSGMLTPPAVFIYTKITHLTQACRTLSRSSFITTSWCNRLANYRILLCPEVFIEPQSSTNNMQMICTKCRALGVFFTGCKCREHHLTAASTKYAGNSLHWHVIGHQQYMDKRE
jgi:hypothetical protein